MKNYWLNMACLLALCLGASACGVKGDLSLPSHLPPPPPPHTQHR